MSSTGKQAGKAEWAGRRRPATRRAGFSATTPVQLDVAESDGIRLQCGEVCKIEFVVPPTRHEQRSGFGGWMRLDGGFDVALSTPDKTVLIDYPSPSWNKFGALDVADPGTSDGLGEGSGHGKNLCHLGDIDAGARRATVTRTGAMAIRTARTPARSGATGTAPPSARQGAAARGRPSAAS